MKNPFFLFLKYLGVVLFLSPSLNSFGQVDVVVGRTDITVEYLKEIRNQAEEGNNLMEILDEFMQHLDTLNYKEVEKVNVDLTEYFNNKNVTISNIQTLHRFGLLETMIKSTVSNKGVPPKNIEEAEEALKNSGK